MLISIVVPVYRNADTLAELHARLVSALRPGGHPFEIIFVNDACPAGSDVILRQLMRDPRVRVVTLERNEGQHRAVRRGLAAGRGDLFVVMDADLQDPPEAIPLLLNALAKRHAKVAFVGRRGEYQSAARMATSKVFKRLMRLLCGVPMDAGSQVAMRRDVVDTVLRFPAERPYMNALIGLAGAPMVSVPFARAPRPVGRSAYSGAARARVAWHGIRTALYLRWWKWINRQLSGTKTSERISADM